MTASQAASTLPIEYSQILQAGTGQLFLDASSAKKYPFSG